MTSSISRSNYKDLIASLHRENLSTYYLLPLMGLSKDRFGSPTFLNSYLSPDGKFIYVTVYDTFLLQDPSVLSSNYLKDSWSTRDGVTLCYRIPSTWKHEVNCYLRGQYTLFRSKAKDIIYNDSTLVYNLADEMGIYHTDPRLLALDRSAKLKEWLENEFNCPIEMKELLPPPGPDAFLHVK